MTCQSKAYACALLTVLFWSTIASAGKISLRYLRPVELVFYASIVSSAVLLITLIFQKKLPLLKQLSIKTWGLSIGYGLLNPFLYYLVLFKAYDILPAQQAQVINYTWAITLSLLSVPFLGHQVTGRQWMAIALSYSGVLVIATKGHILSLQFDSPIGVMLALLSTLIWAMYWILNTRDNRDPAVGLFLNFLCAIPFILVYMACTSGFRKLPLPGVAGAVYIGIFEMGLSFVLWLSALKLTSSTAKIANLIFISPFASLVFIYFFVGESVFPSTIAGLFLVVGGLLIQALGKEKFSDIPDPDDHRQNELT